MWNEKKSKKRNCRKKLLKKYILFLIFILCSTSFADVFDFPFQKKDSLKIEKILSKMNKNSLIRGDFKQIKQIKKINKNFTSTGKFVVEKKKGVIWKTEKPFFVELVITEKNMIQKSIVSKTQMNISENAIFKEISQTIQEIFSGDLNGLSERFDVYFINDQNNNLWFLGLIPKETLIKKQIQTIEIQGNIWINSLTLLDGSNNLIYYEFSNIKENSSLTDEERELLKN